MQSLISVIVPVYNVEKYLNRCVESIVNQTYENLEIILVDDGSTDNCPEICEEWAEKDNRIKVVHKQNGGLSSARNAGMDIMHGEYVLFIDSDDYIDLKMAEEMYKKISKDDYDVCLCNSNSVDNDYNIIYTSQNKSVIFEGKDIIYNFLSAAVFDSFSVCDKMYKVSVLKNNNLRFDETIKWGEDYPFNYHCFKVINKLISVENAYYYYLISREGSITYNVTYGSVNRWKNIKMVLEAEKDNSVNYEIVLKKYASELLCILRELLRDGNRELIKENYKTIIDEIKKYYAEFIKLNNLNRKVKFSIMLINVSPNAFKFLYKFLFCKKNRS